MSNDDQSLEDQRREIGNEFDRAVDPLKQHDDGFRRMEARGIDPFEMYLDEIVRESNRDESTVGEYERAVSHFKEYMRRQDRHPACANDRHIIGFANHEFQDKENGKDSVKTKLRYVAKAYEYFVADNVYPHSTDYSPINQAWGKIAWPEEEEKEQPRVTRDEMREALADVTHVMKLAVLMLGLKLGMRQGEIRNVQLREIHLQNSELQNHYPTLGNHPRLDQWENAIFVPSKFNRDGNKSWNPRVLPLDDEMRQILTQYLLIRPDCGEPWVFVSQTHHERIRDKDGINRHWREQIRPHIEVAEYEKELTSHFGRHWFTTFWKIEKGMEKEHVQYMRGDRIGDGRGGDTIDEYLHAYYPNIKEQYRNEIYKLL